MREDAVPSPLVITFVYASESAELKGLGSSFLGFEQERVYAN